MMPKSDKLQYLLYNILACWQHANPFIQIKILVLWYTPQRTRLPCLPPPSTLQMDFNWQVNKQVSLTIRSKNINKYMKKHIWIIRQQKQRKKPTSNSRSKYKCPIFLFHSMCQCFAIVFTCGKNRAVASTLKSSRRTVSITLEKSWWKELCEKQIMRTDHRYVCPPVAKHTKSENVTQTIENYGFCL